ncbi:UNKNOWN [Stylonychia lemnae]|uniref:Transmembrane protein n=1 Tax=Stylonychia lemnae TaxID=5949 RepID=A0A078A423_STYLE|nr:UNKNOWN [Stylonychia lemnae]|eukprot:CDW75514.1 UNKNOWN [Stylonychia lemnae]
MAMLSKLRTQFPLNKTLYLSQIQFGGYRARAQNHKPKGPEPVQKQSSTYVTGQYKIPKKGSQEYQAMLTQAKEAKKEVKAQKIIENLTPRFASALIFSSTLPQTFLTYQIIWADPCSDAFFQAFQFAGSAACGLGYIDYRTIVKQDPELQYGMRKKRLAFTKFAFMLSVIGLMLIDTPTPNCVFPLILGSIWNAMKLGTQISYNLTPEKFFFARTFLSFYNLAFLIAVWYKLRQGRKEKLDIEYSFFNKVEGVMIRMGGSFQEQLYPMDNIQLQP